MSDDYLHQFIDDVKQIFVTAARQQAVSSQPHQIPSLARIQWPLRKMINQLSLEVPKPLVKLGQNEATAIMDMWTIITQTSGLGIALLNEIAMFPRGVILTDLTGEPIPPASAKKLKVTKIEVSLVDVYSNGDEGQFNPTFPGSMYTVDVRIEEDLPLDPKDRFTFFPPIKGLSKDKYILFGHRKAGSRMAVTLFHELVHVWYVNKYWFWNGQNTNNLGHGTYEMKQHDPWWDEATDASGAITYPFKDELEPFYSMVDTLEGTKPPLQPTPVQPWP